HLHVPKPSHVRAGQAATVLAVVDHRLFFVKHPINTDIYTLSLHDALPILVGGAKLLEYLRLRERREEPGARSPRRWRARLGVHRSEEHTSELQSLRHLVCRLLLEKKKDRRHHDSCPDALALVHASHVLRRA